MMLMSMRLQKNQLKTTSWAWPKNHFGYWYKAPFVMAGYKSYEVLVIGAAGGASSLKSLGGVTYYSCGGGGGGAAYIRSSLLELGRQSWFQGGSPGSQGVESVVIDDPISDGGNGENSRFDYITAYGGKGGKTQIPTISGTFTPRTDGKADGGITNLYAASVPRGEYFDLDPEMMDGDEPAHYGAEEGDYLVIDGVLDSESPYFKVVCSGGGGGIGVMKPNDASGPGDYFYSNSPGRNGSIDHTPANVQLFYAAGEAKGAYSGGGGGGCSNYVVTHSMETAAPFGSGSYSNANRAQGAVFLKVF